MGTTTSRPIVVGIESVLLQAAQFIDVAVHIIERILSTLFSLCVPSTLYRDYPIDSPDHSPLAGRVKQHAQFKQRYEEKLKRRKLRAEWAAAGLDVVEMERQEQAKRKRQQQKAAIQALNEKHRADEMLGPVPQAPLPRPENERETAAEKAQGKLHVMSNLSPTKDQHNRLPKRQDDKTEIRMPESLLHRRAAALESVRETSFHEASNYAVQGHGSRIASGVSEHGDISYQIVATSRDHDEGPLLSSESSIRAVPKSPDQLRRKLVTPQGIMPSQSQAVVSTSSASRLDALVRPAAQRKAGPADRPSSPKLFQPTAQRHRRSIDLVTALDSPDQSSFRQHERKDSIDLRSDSPRFFNRARASLDMVTNAASQMSRPSSPSSSPPNPPFSSASSDAGSIRSIFRSSSPANSLSRSSTPPCVTDLADRACKSRWEANARERKVWKNEVDRITLHKLQQTSKRHRPDSQERLPLSNLSELNTNLTLAARRRQRRVSHEPDQGDKPEKIKRRSFQKPPTSHRKDL
jgi:hypothetical protein